MRDFQVPGRSVVRSRKAMVATSSGLASFEAVNVLKNGGNAVDAAIVASAVLCVCEPHMTGTGGDCFAIVNLPDGEVAGLNGSGRASRKADGRWLAGSGLSEIASDSIHAVTVPGAIDAWDRLLKTYGTMSLGEALQPAIHHARNGIAVGERTAFDWAGKADMLAQDEGSARHLLFDGKAPSAGQVVRFPALAKTLEAIAQGGRDAFYHGCIADDMIATLAVEGGLLDGEDFAATQADWVKPVTNGFAGREVVELPPNAQGITALVALNVLKNFDLAGFSANSPERWHVQIEAMKQATVLQHRHIADVNFMEIGTDELLDGAFARRLAARISPDRAENDPEANMPQPGSDTVYLCVVDENGMGVSFINSLFGAFGSGRTTLKTGITLQNRGGCFVADPSHPNCIGPGKRPRHTLIPGLLRKDNRMAAVFGVMGGAFQPMGHVSVLVNRLVYGMNPQAALDFPRLFHTEGKILAERGFATQTLAGLSARGHKVEIAPAPWGCGQYIEIDRDAGALAGASDPRKDGMAVGY